MADLSPTSRPSRIGAHLHQHDLGRRSVLLLAGAGAAGLLGLRVTSGLADAQPMARRAPAPTDAGLPAPPHPPEPGTRAEEPWTSGALGDWENSAHAASTPEEALTARRQDGVHLVGDSIGTRILEPLRARLGDRPLAHDVWNGRPSAPAVDALADLAAADLLAPTVVVVLGSNDVFDPWYFEQQVARVVEIAGRRRVLWVTPYVSRRSAPSADVRNSAVLGLVLERAAVAGDIELVRWFELVARSGEAIADLVEDGVHPSAQGADALAELVLTTLG